MSKIKEMALNAYPKLIFKPVVEVVSSIDEKPTYVDYNEAKRAIYIEGAKAVLKEVEDIVYRRYSDDGDPNQRNKDLIKLIQQLKG